MTRHLLRVRRFLNWLRSDWLDYPHIPPAAVQNALLSDIEDGRIRFTHRVDRLGPKYEEVKFWATNADVEVVVMRHKSGHTDYHYCRVDGRDYSRHPAGMFDRERISATLMTKYGVTS